MDSIGLSYLVVSMYQLKIYNKRFDLGITDEKMKSLDDGKENYIDTQKMGRLVINRYLIH